MRTSSSLLRAASTSFTGAAPLLAPSPQPELSRVQSRREEARQRVQERMVEVILNRYFFRVAIFAGLMVLIAVSTGALSFWVLWADIYYWDGPCDEPLRLYLLVMLMLGRIIPKIQQALRQRVESSGYGDASKLHLLISIGGSLPGMISVFWGIRMIWSSTTCASTNPGLFYPNKYYIFLQACFFPMATLFFSVDFLGTARVLSTLSDGSGAGCEEAVHKLPRVQADDPELIDETDNQVMDCPICQEVFAQCSTVIRTPCAHHFHEDCLAKWCQNHNDCPLCRSVIEPLEE
eukprot:CAMPEP_0170653368 /NCGR_PEP_ID=MMETSP0224-20130122/47370_1 /TAXON_ID=285029 /ORGANISM="Togula jolla, Strain CCCM 725" /LENGTH=290 /DNA_ID=CAMNT_0010985235 /DNA_START=58 /DNA_END=927 /DNA_ORIENTATION=-